MLLIATSEVLEIWSIAEVDEPVRLGDMGYGNLRALGNYQKFLEPNTLLSAKRGRQLALFPQAVELMTSARKDAADRLAPIVAEAVRQAIRILDPTVTDIEDARERENDPLFANASQLTIGALTELMISAKFEVSQQDGDLLQNILNANFREFAEWRSGLHGLVHDAFQAPLEVLRTDIDYSGLEPSLASEVYETALLPKRGSKKRAGIFYTPPELARRLIDLLPIEELLPGQRTVLDPTCGSGTLLLAAHDRLEQLDREPDVEHVHQRLLQSIYGWDSDPFAVNIARLCLLLNALPNGNGWKVLKRDALTGHADQSMEIGQSAAIDIVVMNPPWLHSHTTSNDERASRFLSRAVDIVRPGGLVGAVMPAGWLTKNACKNDREQFLNLCNLMEVVRLPERVFAGAEYAPALLIAQRKFNPSDTAPTWLHRRVVRRENLRDFFRSGFVDESEVVEPGSGPPDVLTTNSLVKALRKREWAETLENVAEVLSVPPVENVKELTGQGDWLWLRKAGTIRAFGAITHDSPLQRVQFPNDFARGQNVAPRSFNEIKVLVSSQKRPDNPWRLKPLLDLIGIIPRNSLYLVVAAADKGRLPAEAGEDFEMQVGRVGPTTLAILALLGSAVASAWVDGQSTILNIHRKTILSLPLPGGWLSLAALGKRLALEARESNISVRTARELDEAVFDLYGLDDNERSEITDHMANFAAPEGSLRYTASSFPIAEDHGPRYYGATLAVKDDRLLLWAPGVTDDDGIWVDPPLAMPGAAAREGATFTARGKDLAEAIYGFQEMSFIDDEALTRPRLP
jgi:hypothetical protein